jgi:hypothetical protein
MIINEIVLPETWLKIQLFLRGVARYVMYYEECRIWGVHNSGYEYFIFRDTTPCSPLKLTDVSEEHVASIFTELKSKPSKKSNIRQEVPEYRSDILLRNIGWLWTDYAALYPTK